MNEVPPRLPRSQDAPEVAAAVTRSDLGLGPEVPIPNLINTLEKAGVFVLALPRNFTGRDAFSLWAIGPSEQRRPVIVVTPQIAADRLRMSVAHELGHLVMHSPLALGIGDVENQAKQFSAEFMLPGSAMRQEIRSPITLETFLDMKVRWGVSIQALIIHAHRLGIITPRKYKSLYSRLGARGWRMREPLSRDVPMERPRALRQIAEMIYGQRISYKRVAADTRMREDFVKDLLKPYASRSSKAVEGEHPQPDDSPSGGKVLAFSRKK